MEFKEIKNKTFRQVDKIITNHGLRLWLTIEKKGGILEIEYIKVHAGITIESIFVLFGWNGKCMGMRIET